MLLAVTGLVSILVYGTWPQMTGRFNLRYGSVIHKIEARVVNDLLKLIHIRNAANNVERLGRINLAGTGDRIGADCLWTRVRGENISSKWFNETDSANLPWCGFIFRQRALNISF